MNERKSYKYLSDITAIFVMILLLSNLVACKITKLSILGLDISFASGLLFFPVSYLVGDLLTEVYGYSKSRKVIWLGFGALLFANIVIKIMIALPPDPNWGLQEEYEKIFTISSRTSIASIMAYWAGEFCNSLVLAKMKIWTQGKYQMARIVGSTVAGEFVDTLIFYPLAFWGHPSFPPALVIKVMFASYTIKVLWEIIVYPFTKRLISFLKKSENEDYYDTQTDFSPFKLEN
jgi:uncharacterized integral membrane protein (TIGR00697 family)